MSSNLQALQSAIKLLADAAEDTVEALQPGETALQRLFAYENLGADLMALIPQMSDIPSEASQLAPSDYVTLAQSLVDDLAITNPQAESIIAASLKLLNDLATTILADVDSLVAAIRATLPPTPPAKAA
jgi:hypothetical protein